MNRAGRFRFRVVIEEKVEAGRGEPPTWQDLIERWCNITPLAGSEYFQAQQAQASVSHKIEFPWDRVLGASLSSEHRIRHGERIFEIESVIDMRERNERIQAMCREDK